MCVTNIYFLEGLPGAGKTSALAEFANDPSILTIEEVLKRDELEKWHNQSRQDYFLENDIKKLELATESLIKVVSDRSPISTLVFNLQKEILDGHEAVWVIDWFETEVLPVLKRHRVKFLFLDVEPDRGMKRKRYVEDSKDPWSNTDSLTRARQLYLDIFNKYQLNYKIIDSNTNIDNLLLAVNREVKSSP